MRKIFKKIHLWLSIPFGIVIAILCITGCLLVFEEELTRTADRELYFTEHAGQQRLTMPELVDRVSEQLPEKVKISTVSVFSDEDRNVKIILRRGKGICMADPYTGEICGYVERNEFFTTVRRLHTSLLQPFKKDSFHWGKLLVGLSTLALVIILLSGLALWFPKKRKYLKDRFRIKSGAGSFRFWYDLHVAGGFYVCLFLLAMALTGLNWSFPWYRTGFYHLFGIAPGQEKKVEAVAENPSASSLRTLKRKPADYRQWDRVLSELQQRYPDYVSITLSNAAASVSASRFGNTEAKDNFVFDPADGKIVKESYYKDLPKSRRAGSLLLAIHSGSWGGVFSKILYVIATLTGVTLVFTGYYFWIRKKLNKRKNRKKQSGKH